MHGQLEGDPVPAAPRPAVFVDRDGTVNKNPPSGDFVRSPKELRLLPGAAKALKRLSEAGFRLVVFSNQSGLSTGRIAPEDLARVNAHLEELLSKEGVRLDGIYVCPHARGSTCECRKPRPGLVLQAARELDIDLARSWAVGDAARDLEAGRAAGCRVVLVHGDSYPGGREAGEALGPEASVSDLAQAAEFIVSRGG
jgi:D-glycero-D-manno-heptose 1,7-bisphosphate phosphatase